MTAHWDNILLAFLHDPPDKALSIRGHVSRARDNARIAIGDDDVSRKLIEENVDEADPMAAVVERLPMPEPGEAGERAVDPKAGVLCVIHPLSGKRLDLQAPALTGELRKRQHECLSHIVKDLFTAQQDHAFNRYLAVWRLWPDALADKVDPCFSRLPADTRTPDHTIWNHNDLSAAFKAAQQGGDGRTALLAFALGPVQPFIEVSRSVRDLWSGSMILSWLAFHSMLPVIKKLGPTALVYPALRGNPLLDLWMRKSDRLGDKVSLPEMNRRLTPSLPHRFLALVPWSDTGSEAQNLAKECRQAVANEWKKIADAVRKELRRQLDSTWPGWDRRWDDQIASYFQASTAVVPLGGSGEEVDKRLASLLTGKQSFAEAFKDADEVRGMAGAIPATDAPKYPQDHAGRWQHQVELVQRALTAQRAIRHMPAQKTCDDPNARYPLKCTLLGTFEQMGPDDLTESDTFWKKAADPVDGLTIGGVRIRKGEALCAVALVKRFAGPAFLADRLNVQPSDLRFPDTLTVAAAKWLREADIDPEEVRKTQDDWNGQWLHWNSEQDDPDQPRCPREVFETIKAARDRVGKPPPYYAILKLDGDDLGGWLRGENSPKVRDVMHSDLVRYFENLGERAKAGLEAKRPVGPALHAAISTALTNFALHAVPHTVRRHHGTTIYSGGDDTLVLLPVSTALACALDLRRAYMSDWWRPNGQEPQSQNQRNYLMMGSRATLSGGLVAVHAKDDLRLALQDARRAEKQAKDAGRNALVITIRRRSGEHTSALCPWDFAETIENWRQQFVKGASNRWVYRLYSERSALEGLPVDAVKAEMRRQLARAEEPTPTLIPTDGLIKAFDDLCCQTKHFLSTAQALHNFLTLCHTASFLARGSD